VDDDPDDHFVFATALREVDPQVDLKTFSSCADLLSSFAQINSLPHLIVIDMNMPGSDGCQCLKEIRRLEAMLPVPVIMYSTASSPASIKTAYEEGARGFFVKPNSMTDIKTVIHQLLNDWVYKGTERVTESALSGSQESLPAGTGQ